MRQANFQYVCMSETSEHVCMFQAAGRVCMYVSLILGSPKPLKFINIVDGLSKNSTPEHTSQTNITTRPPKLSKFINIVDSNNLLIRVRKSLQSMDTFAQNEIRTKRNLARGIDIFKFPSSGLQIHLLILVYIHTYIYTENSPVALIN